MFYIGTNHPDELTEIRRHALRDFKFLPISGEYLHRDAFDVAEEYGKDIFLAINYLGTSRLPSTVRIKEPFRCAVRSFRLSSFAFHRSRHAGREPAVSEPFAGANETVSRQVRASSDAEGRG